MDRYEVEVTYKFGGDVCTTAFRMNGESMSDARGKVWAQVCLMYPSAIFIKWGYIRYV